MTQTEKLEALRKRWKYVEISQVRLVASGWRVWLVKNYAGKPISRMRGQKLPGNPKAKRKLEYTGFEMARAVTEAYRATFITKKKP